MDRAAISVTSDATGSYYRYAFSMPNFNDYPKLGVWPDAYYMSFNMFSGNAFVGARACAFDRSKMLIGSTATAQCKCGPDVKPVLNIAHDLGMRDDTATRAALP